MRKRTQAREFALQVLYQIDITRVDPGVCLEDFWKRREEKAEAEVREFAEAIVYGTVEHKPDIDKTISGAAQNWELNRMAVVDRNILRMTAYELLYRTDIPPKVSINEAIEIAKRYGDQDSGKFVNGILDKINKTKRANGQDR
jgi:N utilization substance protein B